MKTKEGILRRPLALCALLVPVSLLINSPAGAAELRLSSECSSNQLTLRWQGALGVRLQQTTNLASLQWQDIPSSEGVSSLQLPMTNAMACFRVLDPGLDVDRDDLYDDLERAGWTITVDTSGYCDPRSVEQRRVTSDPGRADTDGDGLDDCWEWIIGTDPRAADTDRDGLTDYEEWCRWLTSPTSVDTDGDARGPNRNLPPSATLFDGNELRSLHTSPTLDDTDGDGRTDCEEYDQPGRNLLVAEVPKLDVQLVDAVDIRLDVQYAEETGKTYEYGTELSESTTATRSFYNENSMQIGVKWGAEITAGPLGLLRGAKFHTEASVGYGHVWATTDETAKTAQNSYSQYSRDSRTRTETAASGSMSAGIRLVNSGPITYTLTDFGLTVRYWLPGGSGGTNAEFKTLATLVPVLGANGLTLAPGDSTPVLQVQATGLNASRVKEFLARPNSLYLEPAYYELENAQGLNFDFLEEVTRWRTARVEIDCGDGRNEEYRVATNVERNEDGSYAGVTLGNVLSNILHIPFQTVPRRTFQPTNATNERVLYSVRDVATVSVTNGFWVVAWSGAGTPQAQSNFEDIVLQAGDEVLLTFAKDDDGDGLFAAEEQHYRTDDSATTDSDGDGLTDAFEARTGWDVVLPTRTYHVYSDPAQADQDGDGLTDLQEFQEQTDPTRPDTDDDGLADGLDSHPLIPAKVLRVKANASGGDGSTWATALTNLQTALTRARDGLATPTNPADDVAEIWVAAGVYKPTTTTNRWVCFELVNNTALYGGFAGGETKLSQRNPDPLFNGTVLSGDLKSNDTSTYGENTNSFAENSYLVCYAGDEVGPGTVLDGFTITGGNANGVDPYYNGGGLLAYHGNPRLQNLLFRANYAAREGGGLYLEGATPPTGRREFLVSDCLFLQNSAGWSGGGLRFRGPLGTSLLVTNCQFIQNETRIYRSGYADGGGGFFAAGYSPTEITLENCIFSLNTSLGHGGGILLEDYATARISRSELRANTAKDGGGLAALCWDAGALAVEVAQSVFWGNNASSYTGGGIYMVAQGGRLYVLNSSFSKNTCTGTSGGGGIWLAAVTNTPVQGLVENCVVWDNAPTPNISVTAGSLMRVRTSCLPEANSYPGAGNIIADPKFVDGTGGDLRLQSSSPCIDRGNNYLDYFPTLPGFQLLPATDLDGSRRVVDGNNNGTETVDMGAYEYQSP